MAFKKPTSFLTDPSEEEADYLAANTPSTPKYVAPDPSAAAPDPDLDANAYSPVTPAAPIIQSGAPAGQPSYMDPDLDPNAYASAQPKSAQLRQELADIAAKRPSKEPGIWRTLAGIGAGIGVGYLTRNANMVANVQDRVMHPGQANWNNQWNDKLAEAQQQEKIEADTQAAAKGGADIAHTQAETRNQNNQADWYNKPDAPKAATPVTKTVEVVGPDGNKKSEIRYIPDPNHPEKYSVLGTPPSVEVKGDPDTQLGIAAWKRISGNEHKEPTLDDLATIKGTFRPDVKDPAITEPLLRIRSTGSKTGVATVDAMSAQQAKQALQAGKEPKEQSETAKKDAAINAAFQGSGRDWNQVMADVQSGKYTDHASDIADHAQKMLKLNPQEQRQVEMADMTDQQVQRAIEAINTVKTKHPNLIGNRAAHPLNSLTRWGETAIGAEPAEVGSADAALETVMAMQPGQHLFRSLGAEQEWKKAAGIDPRTGKPDGTHASLVNPEKTLAGLEEIRNFNKSLKTTILNQHGKPQAQQAPNAAPPPAGAVDPALKAYADQYFGGDIQKAIAYNQAHAK